MWALTPAPPAPLAVAAAPREPTCPPVPTCSHADCSSERAELDVCRSLLAASRPGARPSMASVEMEPEHWRAHTEYWNRLVSEVLPGCTSLAQIEFHDCSSFPCVVAIRAPEGVSSDQVEEELMACPALKAEMEGVDGGVWSTQVDCPEGQERALWFSALNEEDPWQGTTRPEDLTEAFSFPYLRAAQATPLWACQ